MKKAPEIGKFLDQDEMDVYESIESTSCSIKQSVGASASPTQIQ